MINAWQLRYFEYLFHFSEFYAGFWAYLFIDIRKRQHLQAHDAHLLLNYRLYKYIKYQSAINTHSMKKAIWADDDYKETMRWSEEDDD